MRPNPQHNDDHQHYADAVAEGSGGGLQRLRSLCTLYVHGCPEFLSFYSSSTSSFFPFPACLRDISLQSVKRMETLQALSNLTSLTDLCLTESRGSRDERLSWPLLAHSRLTTLYLYTDSVFFASPDPSRPTDREVFSQSSKLLNLCMCHTTGVLATTICSLLSSTLTRLDLTFNYDVEHLTNEQEEALQLLTDRKSVV